MLALLNLVTKTQWPFWKPHRNRNVGQWPRRWPPFRI